jgi:predicted transposase/invertase (TIGR01784 family)
MVKFRRLKEKDIEGNELHRWLAFFDKNTDEETIKRLMTMDTAIGKAESKIRQVLQDEDMLRLYHSHEMAMLDYNSGMNYAQQKGIAIGEQRGIVIGKQEGIAIGEQRGEQKAMAKYVLKMARKGMAVEDIAELTDLSVEEVNRLLT